MTDEPAPAPDGRRPLGVIVIALVQFGRAALIAMQLLEFNPFPDVGWFHAAVQLPEPAVGTVAFAVSRIIGVGPAGRQVDRRSRRAPGPTLGVGRRDPDVRARAGVRDRGAGGTATRSTSRWRSTSSPCFYLNQREVRSVFDAGAEDDDASHEHVVAS